MYEILSYAVYISYAFSFVFLMRGLFDALMSFRSNDIIDYRPHFFHSSISFYVGCFIKLFGLKNYEPWYIGLFVLSIVLTVCIGASMIEDYLENKKHQELKKRWGDEYPSKINVQAIADTFESKIDNPDNYELKQSGDSMYVRTPAYFKGFIKIKDQSVIDELISGIKSEFHLCSNFQHKVVQNEEDVVLNFNADCYGSMFFPRFINKTKYGILDYEIAGISYLYSDNAKVELFKYYADVQTDVSVNKTIKIPGLEEKIDSNKEIVKNKTTI